MDESQGADFRSPYPNSDDTALWILRMGLLCMMLTTLMQQAAQRYARLIHVTGGALNLLKCFWYGIQWYYSDTGIPRMRKIQDDDPTIIDISLPW
jgi:hypothetical protein